MTANPLINAARPTRGDVGQLTQHVENLNRLRWVADSGFPYFLNSRERADGTTEHFVDRKIV